MKFHSYLRSLLVVLLVTSSVAYAQQQPAALDPNKPDEQLTKDEADVRIKQFRETVTSLEAQMKQGDEKFNAATKKLADLRKKYSALRRGDQKVVWSTDRVGDEPDAGIFAAALLSFALSIDDYIITSFNKGQTNTMPIHIWDSFKVEFRPQVNVLASMILIVSAVLLVGSSIVSARRAK